jgi:hypothetical protein
MKPTRVIAGENAPDVDELIEKANSMDDMLEKVARLTDDSQMRNITGVEEAPMAHYWTNQQQPEEGIETVSKKTMKPETLTFDETANPHQTGSTLSAHENTAGGIMKGSTGVKKAGNPLAALSALAGKGGGGPPPPPGADMGGEDPMGGGDPMGEEDPMGGGDDDPHMLAEKIKGLVDKLADGGGGGDPMGEEDPMGGEMGGEMDGPPGPM